MARAGTSALEFVEENFPTKYSSSDDNSKRRTFNRNSHRFANQLQAVFDIAKNSPQASFDLEQLYFANNSPTSWGHHSLNSYKKRRVQDIRSKRNVEFGTDERISKTNACNYTSIEVLDEVQLIRPNRSFPLFWFHHQYGVTLRPILKSMKLQFTGVRWFQAAIEKLIETHLSGTRTGATALYVDDIPDGDGSISTETKVEACECIQEVRHIDLGIPHGWRRDWRKVFFDQDEHSFVLIPRLSKHGGFTSFDMKECFACPFQFEFAVDGHWLSHKLELPLTFQHHPQRLRLVFLFDLPDDSQIVVLSFLTVFSVIPVLPIPSISASVNLFETNFAPQKMDSAGPTTEAERLMNALLLDNSNGRYFDTGRRLRFGSVPFETLRYDGFGIGFNFIYEIQPKPNTELRVDNHRSRQRTRREIKFNIKSDWNDYKLGYY